jgi:hypothetical protein
MRSICIARKPIGTTVASAVVDHGVGALNVAGCRIPGIDPANAKRLGRDYTTDQTRFGDARFGQKTHAVVGGSLDGRWPSNVVLTPEAASDLNAQSGMTGGGGRRVNADETFHEDGAVHEGYRRKNRSSLVINVVGTVRTFGDEGGASRFFRVIS